jgi:hypothetical protein
MTRQEEILVLRENPHHYLWRVLRKNWTEDDIENLKNPSENLRPQSKRTYMTRHTPRELDEFIHPKEKKVKAATRPQKTKVQMVSNGETKEYESIADASRQTGIREHHIFGFVNRGKPQVGDVIWKKKNNN